MTEPRWFLLLRAACSFVGTFTQQDLAVRAWEMFPAVFGLAGYEHTHPDANATNAKLYGCIGIVERGHVERCDDGLFRVTEAGRLALDAGASSARRSAKRKPVTLAEVFASTPRTTTLGSRSIGVPH